MEGPSIRTFPRMELRIPIELRLGKKTLRVEKPLGNLSVGGLFVNCEDLPVNADVHVCIQAAEPVEADGVVRFVQPDHSGVGIEFVKITEPDRQRLDRLIADLTRRGASVV